MHVIPIAPITPNFIIFFSLKKALYFPFKQLGHGTLFYMNGSHFLNLHLKGLVSESEVIRGYEYKYKNSAKRLAHSLPHPTLDDYSSG